MHLFKHFWKLVSRNRMGIILYSIITVVMLIIAGVAVKDEGNKTDTEGQINLSKSLDISYVDNDKSALSQAILEYIAKDNVIYDYSDKTEEEIKDLMYFEIITFHIEIPEGFQNKLSNDEEVNIEYSTSVQQSSYSYRVENIINSYTNTYSMYIKNGCSEAEAIDKTNKAMDQELDIKVYSDKENYAGMNPKEYVVYSLSLYITYLSFGMIAMSVGRSIITSNNENVSARIGAGPISNIKRTTINTLGLYSFAFVLLVIYTIGIYIYAGDTILVKEKGHLLIISTFITLLYNSSMTAVIAALRVKGNTISMIVNIFGLAMSFLSGVFVPIWFLGDNVIRIAKFLPFYWTTSTLAIIYPECGAGYSFDAIKIYENFGIGVLYVIVFALVAMLIERVKRQ